MSNNPVEEEEVLTDEEPDDMHYEEKPLCEIGGTIVYDNQATLLGCPKITNYFTKTQEARERKVNRHALFTPQEVAVKSQQCGYNEKARERDFNN